MSLLKHLRPPPAVTEPSNPTRPLVSHSGSVDGDMLARYLWLRTGDRMDVQLSTKTERFGDIYIAAWTDECGRPGRRVISRLEWIELGGRDE